MRVLLLVCIAVCLACGKDEKGLYKIEVEKSTLSVGEEGVIRLKFIGLGGYHWNQDYPSQVLVDDATRIETTKKRFFKDDFSVENGIGVLSISAKSNEVGRHIFKGKASFSICTEKECRFFKGVEIGAEVEVR